MRCVAWRSKIRADGGRAGATTAALVRTGPSSSAAEAVTRCRLRDVNSAAARLQHKVSSTKPDQTLRGHSQSTGEGATHARIEAGGLNVPRQPRHAESCAILGMNSPARGCQVVELAIYTVEGRQAGDLRRKCGSVLIRRAKTRRAFE